MIYLELFRVFATIGLLGFGGGYGATALMQDLIVSQQGWLTMKEFADVVTVSEMTPGPMGINIASFVGVQTAGIPGTVAATVSYVMPSAVIVMALARIYMKYRSLDWVQEVLRGLQPAVCALIISAAVRLTGNAVLTGTAGLNWPAVCVCLVLLTLLRKKKIAPIPAILTSGAAGVIIYGVLWPGNT